MAIKEKLVIFDGNALLHRAFHALPPFTTRDGMLVNAVYGFTTIFLRVLKELKPKYVAVTFDRKEATFRHEAFKEYKAQRIKQPQELYDQIPWIKKIIFAFRLPVFEAAGFEADDVIGTIAEKVKHTPSPIETIIVTGDLDTLQLIDDHTKVYTLKRGMNDTIIYDDDAVKERYGLQPAQLIDFKALRGDPSDNIPGVKGIGEKTALELIKEFDSIKGIYTALHKGDNRLANFSAKVVELLKNFESEAELSQKLVTIVRNVEFDFSLASCKLQAFDNAKLVELFQRLEFKSLLPKIPELQQKLELKSPNEPGAPAVGRPNHGKYHLIESEAELGELVSKIKRAGEFAFDTETTSLDPWQSELVGISIATKAGEAYFIKKSPIILKSRAWGELADLFNDKKILKIAHNAKFDLEVLKAAGQKVQGVNFDTLIAAYLIKSGERVLDLKSLVFQELGVEMQTIEELIGKKGKGQKNMSEVPIVEVTQYACADADFTLRLKDKLEPELKSAKLLELFSEVEMPLVPVLAQIEGAGVKINTAYLAVMEKELKNELASLEKQIHKHAGREFNINSPKQLKEILFDELKISPEGLRHTKTGVSTAAAELEKMRGLHPVIELLFGWRELSKLLSTYVEALPELVNKKTGRVHTSFNQTVTATGRLSSSDPNLQNIPIRGDWGKRLRQAFIAEPGFKLLSADYSQIELRIAAHLAQDKRMIQIFKQGEDIHTSTAAFIFGIEPSQITPDQRRSAKEVNFGVLYGMGVWGLSERTGISRSEASDFIDKYFRAFSGVAKWIEDIKMSTRERGFVTTLLGRKRNLPEINSGVQQVRSAAERMAVNLPVQGTAADLLKIAMVKVAKKLPEISKKTRMILQVHDELVFEVPQKDVVKVAKLVKHEMEQAIKLSVPIVVDVKMGDNWGEMEKIDI
ncbi:MAG: DNA polymerase I [Patescibacteria group bacterium]